ncbi:cellulase family glycosylhydrolase [Abyssalbus ytuae]|uniref:Cellulase family glycosylhydrolase n=1 Tax=Abyssalbus ytuae TaxID=2926907 RepID=A0A9E6ZQJ5_9FLAO|nr:cellulase family glycosylhydrolase [Abyssalbus ytuae]UOB18735.1 cellulase family glycosylhydrolase [Abyssalbus ytuae]
MKIIHQILRVTLMLAILFVANACNDDDNNNIPDSSISVNQEDLSFIAQGGEETFNITASLSIKWGANTSDDWLSVSQDSGVGSTSITVTARANTTGGQRTGVVTVFTHDKSFDIQVTQNAFLLTISPDSNGMSNYTAVELTGMMGVGWNVGNSLDAVGGETAWGNPMINKQLIDAVKEAGFNTVRIPVAWSNYIQENDENYIISVEGLNRVEEVVNYVLDNDMFAIINIHWDGGWMQPTYEDQNYVNNRLSKMWEQIAIHFRDYDYHLIFAGTNEVMVDGDYGTPTEEYYTVQNSFNQKFISTVRETGGKNAYRYLTVQGFNTNIDHTVNFAVIPDDIVENRMLMEVHYYDPYDFTLNVDSDNVWQWGSIPTDPSATAGWGDEDWLEAQFQKMYGTFVSQGIGVILGEYGASYREEVDGAETYREYYYEKTTESALEHGMVPITWDNGYTDNHNMGLFNRSTGEEAFPAIIDAITNP